MINPLPDNHLISRSKKLAAIGRDCGEWRKDNGGN